MKLEVGKSYFLRDGSGPFVAKPDTENSPSFPKCKFVLNGCLYQENGKFGNDDYIESFDAVRELLTLQDGKYYEDANGEVQGPLRKYAHGESFELSSATTHFWQADGTAYKGHDCVDLLFEIPEPASEKPDLCEDEGCDRRGTDHGCVTVSELSNPVGYTVLTVMHTPADIKRARKTLKELARLLPPQP